MRPNTIFTNASKMQSLDRGSETQLQLTEHVIFQISEGLWRDSFHLNSSLYRWIYHLNGVTLTFL